MKHTKIHSTATGLQELNYLSLSFEYFLREGKLKNRSFTLIMPDLLLIIKQHYGMTACHHLISVSLPTEALSFIL